MCGWVAGKVRFAFCLGEKWVALQRDARGKKKETTTQLFCGPSSGEKHRLLVMLCWSGRRCSDQSHRTACARGKEREWKKSCHAPVGSEVERRRRVVHVPPEEDTRAQRG